MRLMPDHPVAPRIVRTRGFTADCGEPRSVIFVANLLSLFFGNREGARRLEAEISCVDSYGGRLLPILGLIFGDGQHVLVLERHPDPALVGFFRSLGLKLPAVEILTRGEFLELGRRLLEGSEVAADPLVERWRRLPADTLDGYVTDDTIGRLAGVLGKRTLSTPEGSHRGNNKLLLHRHLESIGLPVFPTRLAGSHGELAQALAAFRGEGYRAAVIKSQIGASGIGMIKLATDATAAEIPAGFCHEGPCMVQAWLQPGDHGIVAVLSPSVQMFVHDDAVHLYDLTEQILDESSIHQGNESPPGYLDEFPELADDLHRLAGETAVWLHRQGYRGPASADFLVTRLADGSVVVYVCEINARVTGATYPAVMARHFHPEGAWLMRNLELSVPLAGDELLERLRIHDELFDPGRRTGILPLNFNLDPDGLVRKGQFLAIADEPAACREFLSTGRHDLPVKWDYTRDR